VAGGLQEQVIDQTVRLVHFRAGSLSADPLCCTTQKLLSAGCGRLSIGAVAREVHRLRAALAFRIRSPHGPTQLLSAAPGNRRMRGPQAQLLPCHDPPRSGPRRRRTTGRQPGLQPEAPGTVPGSGAAPRALSGAA
jgi:hypothetical protein